MKGEKKKKKKEDERWLALERKDGLRKKFAGWVSRRVEVRSWVLLLACLCSHEEVNYLRCTT
jgi:hypothetical protein